MYSIGEHIIYGTNGICRIGEIRSNPFDPSDERLFYILYPLFDTSNSKIFTPVDNPNVVMRRPVSKEAAERLFDLIPDIGTVEVDDERKRREIYRNAVQTTDLEKYISVIKTVVKRRAAFRKLRRRLPDLDNDFEHTARNCLYGELATVLGIEREEVHNRIVLLTE
ncbi:MAG: CarD family transcriptional regulator [Clostridia bacterium]|nr:CarD family transcriptional regulator [Clostridia bacterium]